MSVVTIDRKTGIGGTDMSAIVGMNPWRSAFDVWAEKTGQLPDFAETERMAWGRRIQRAIAEGYSEITGRKHEWLDQTRRSEKRPWQIWTPDAVIVGEPRLLDCKNVGIDQSGEWGEEGTEEVPDHIVIQAQWYMHAGSFELFDVAALFGGNNLKVYTLQRDTEFQEILLDQGEKFWQDHVLAKNAPDISATEGSKMYLAKKFPKNNGKLRTPTVDEFELIETYRKARILFSIAKDEKEDIAAAVKQAIGDDDGFQWGEGKEKEKVTWKKTKDGKKTDWQSLALPLLARLPEDERKALVDLQTSDVPGHRRIYAGFKGGQEDGND